LFFKTLLHILKTLWLSKIQNIKEFLSIQEGRLKGWELDSCGDCWVSEGCLVDTNDTPAPIDAQMYRWNQVKENSSSASIDPILHFFMFCSSKLI